MGNQITQLTKSTYGTEYSGYDTRGLSKHPTLKLINTEKKVDPMLTLEHINSKLLRCIFQKNVKEMKKELDKLKRKLDKRQYNHELILAFWFAVHLEEQKMASEMMQEEQLIKQLVLCAYMYAKNNTTHNNSESNIKTSSQQLNIPTHKSTMKQSNSQKGRQEESDIKEEDDEDSSESEESEEDEDDEDEEDEKRRLTNGQISEEDEENEESSSVRNGSFRQGNINKKRQSAINEEENEDSDESEEENEDSSEQGPPSKSSKSQSKKSKNVGQKKKQPKGKVVDESDVSEEEEGRFNEGGEREGKKSKSKKSNQQSNEEESNEEESGEDNEDSVEDDDDQDDDDDDEDESDEEESQQTNKKEELKLSENETSNILRSQESGTDNNQNAKSNAKKRNHSSIPEADSESEEDNESDDDEESDEDDEDDEEEEESNENQDDDDDEEEDDEEEGEEESKQSQTESQQSSNQNSSQAEGTSSQQDVSIKSAKNSKRSQSVLDETSREHKPVQSRNKSKKQKSDSEGLSSIEGIKTSKVQQSNVMSADEEVKKKKGKNKKKVNDRKNIDSDNKDDSGSNISSQVFNSTILKKKNTKEKEPKTNTGIIPSIIPKVVPTPGADLSMSFNNSSLTLGGGANVSMTSGGGGLASMKSQIALLQQKKREEEEMKKKEKDKIKKEKEAVKRDNEMMENMRKLEQMGVNQDTVSNVSISDKQSLTIVKLAFRTKFQTLMTNILRIALQKNEDIIACIMTAYYDLSLNEDMLITGLASNKFQWLMFLWAFEKNILGVNPQPTFDDEDNSVVTFAHLFELIKDQHKHDGEEEINRKLRIILEWKLMTKNDNIIQALLYHHYNALAIEYMGYYSHLLNEDLFIFSLKNGNSEFLRVALLQNAFDKMIFREESVIGQMLSILREGYRLNFILNSLTLIDISVWKNKHLKEILDCIKGYLDDQFDKNRLLLSSNPLMSISLAAEILGKIADSRKKFENECFKIKEDLLKMGKMYSSKIDDQRYYEKLVMSTDYKGRTVMKTITLNSFEQLMDGKDIKAENLMLSIWSGKESHKCDGNIYGYSMLSHIIMSRTKKAIGKKYSLRRVITNFFQPNFDVDYKFQFRYRTKSISYLFYKEFICACLVLCLFQYVNLQYLTLFSDIQIKGTTNDAYAIPTDEAVAAANAYNITYQKQMVENSKMEYGKYNFLSYLCAGALIFQLVMKIVFNILSTQKVVFDKWTYLDSANGILNFIAVFMISNINPSSYIIPRNKDYIDYFMIVVLCVSWLRFFSYFLVVRNISKLLLTLLEMIADTLSFLFIVCCFILIMASIFTTLYQDTNQEKYGGLGATVQTLFNDAMAVFDYEGMEGREISHSLLTVFTVFFANILLMNYLIAILSTTYDKMKESGVFKYKCNLHTYCERYLIAFNQKGIGEFIIHPPPISFALILLSPFMFCRSTLIKAQLFFQIVFFWIENIFILIAFLVFEMCMAPFAYLKIWINLFKNSPSFLQFIIGSVVFLIFGPLFVVIFVLLDCKHFLTILNYLNGCKQGRDMVDELAEEQIDSSIRLKLYNEIRGVTINIYKKIQESIKQEEKELLQRENTQKAKKKNKKAQDTTDNSDEEEQKKPETYDYDFFYVDDNFELYNYQILKKILINEWKEMRRKKEREHRMKRQMNEQGYKTGHYEQDVNSVLASSIKKISKNQVQEKKNSAEVQKLQIQNQTPMLMRPQKTSNKQQKSKDLGTQVKMLFLNALKTGVQQNDDEGEVDMSDFEIPQKHIEIVDQFLTRFTITTENSQNEHIDLVIMLKALPNKIVDFNLPQTELFNFRIIQDSITAFQNLNIVNAFEFFDDKNRERVQIVKDNMQEQRNNLNDVKKILDFIKQKIERNNTYNKAKSDAGESSVIPRDFQQHSPQLANQFLKKMTTIRKPFKQHIELENLKKKNTQNVQVNSLGKSTSLGLGRME